MDIDRTENKYSQHPAISKKHHDKVSRSHVIGPRQSTRSTIVIHRRQLSGWARVKQSLLSWTKAVIKILGLRNFSLREHLFYAGILLVMTVIVILCFMFVKNNKSQLYSSAGMRTQYQCLTLANPPDGQVHLSGTLVGDVAMYECDHGFNMTGDKTRVCQVLHQRQQPCSAPQSKVSDKNESINFLLLRFSEKFEHNKYCVLGYKYPGQSVLLSPDTADAANSAICKLLFPQSSPRVTLL